MNPKHIEAFGAIPQPPRESFGFIQDLKSPLEYTFQKGRGCNPGVCADCLANGVRIEILFPNATDFPETAFDSLKRVLAKKEIQVRDDGAYLFKFMQDSGLSHEEYRVTANETQALVEAADSDGLRRAVYFLEDIVCEAEGKALMPGQWQRKPYVKHRVSRCFFGPTNRPPFNIDELMNDVDYYPEEYLNKLAHEAINGLWLTMYLADLPTPLFPERGKDAPRRFAKLRQTAEKCLRYGIRIYVFLSEPKLWSDDVRNAPPFNDSLRYPEMKGFEINRHGHFGFFCTSSEKGKQFLRESVEMIFREVPTLGGIINIMLGEDNGSCVAHQVHWNHAEGETCPLCSQRPDSERYRDLARLFTDAMHKYSPNAEFIGWFYTPSQTDGTDFSKRLLDAVSQWPDDSTVMFNFESGGHVKQLGLDRAVYDYSLAFVGPSKLFGQVCDHAAKKGAKLQVGCSHEDASVPFIPVPENLYDKYHFMYDHGVSAAMQCWYFGNYPGLMNLAAGQLSFEPFPTSADEFLEALARPQWRSDAPLIAKAWHEFSMAYREFPGNLAFEWYGPLHHSIAWPMHLFPSNTPIARSWLINCFPAVSGDRIGECVGFYHTLPEILELCHRMTTRWQAGFEMLSTLRNAYANDAARIADIRLAEAIGLQMKSTENLFRFYSLREDMLYTKTDHLKEMADIVKAEITNTERMCALCEEDPRLGYHSEAEAYLFFPEKLRARVALLNELLDVDFPKFDINAPWVREYTGENPTGKYIHATREGQPKDIQPIRPGAEWSIERKGDNFVIEIKGLNDEIATLAIEPRRMWAAYLLYLRPNSTWEEVVAVVRRRAQRGCFEPEITVETRGDTRVVTLPRIMFQDFRLGDSPMRIHLFGKDFSWGPNELLPGRLMHGDFNSNCAGWLIED